MIWTDHCWIGLLLRTRPGYTLGLRPVLDVLPNPWIQIPSSVGCHRMRRIETRIRAGFRGARRGKRRAPANRDPRLARNQGAKHSFSVPKRGAATAYPAPEEEGDWVRRPRGQANPGISPGIPIPPDSRVHRSERSSHGHLILIRPGRPGTGWHDR